jgi:alanine racemase
MLRHTRYCVDLDAVAHNFRQVRSMLADMPDGSPKGSQAARLATVLKADAYGLGAVPVARVLVREGADMLAVACLPEALQLRAACAEVPILIMGHTPSEYFINAVQAGITCTIFDLEQAGALASAARSSGTHALAHIKVDTGMNRLGLKPESFAPGEAARLLVRMADQPGLSVEGIFTHLALNARKSDTAQFERFSALLDEAAALGLRFALRHVCDSIGLMRYPEYRMDMVRVGAVLYGAKPLNTPLSATADIRTPFRSATRISRIWRITAGEGVGYDYTWRAPDGGALIATLPDGYADGYKRSLSNVASVLVRGVRAPVVGLICMDQCVVDVSAVPDVAEGDDVTLLGGPAVGSPEESIPVLEMASWVGTNRNDVLCSIGRRVPRIYYEAGIVVTEQDSVPGGKP